MKKEDRKRLYTFLKTWTRAEIIARVGGINGPHQLAYQEKLKMEDAIRELLYGSSDLIILGCKWKMINKEEVKKKKKRDKKKKEMFDFFGDEPIKKKRKRK